MIPRRRVLTSLIVMSLMTTLGMGIISIPTSATTTSLTVEGRSGSVTLILSDLQAMDVVQGQSSYQNSLGNWKGAGWYVGVNVSALIAEVGGMVPGDTVTVFASDGYNQTFSYYNVYNDWPVQSIQGPMVVAYSYNGNTTPTWIDGLRIAFIPDDGAYSNANFLATTTIDQSVGSAGSRWVSSVARIVVNVAPWNVTMKKDTATMTYGGQQIVNITSVTGWGGYRKSSGTIVGPDNYTGVNVSVLLQTVGGMSSSDRLKLVSRDNYTQTFTYALATGNASVYTILAYKINSTPLSSSAIPRIAFIGPDWPITTASLWQQAVCYLEILPNQAPVLQPLVDSSAPAGQSLAFNASATDADNDALQYTWDFGDGTVPQSGQNVTHTYSMPGTYAVAVYVDDLTGLPGHNVSSTAVVSISFSLHLCAGWNLMSLPLVGHGYRASMLGLASGDVVIGWNSSAKAYTQNYIVQGSPPVADFDILEGLGYWVYCKTDEIIPIYGSQATGPRELQITVPTGGGWALIGFPTIGPAKKASDIPGMFSPGTVTIVARYDAPIHSYHSYIVGFAPSDFNLVAGQGYWIYCTASGTLSYTL
jgi:PKD repeat protein